MPQLDIAMFGPQAITVYLYIILLISISYITTPIIMGLLKSREKSKSKK